MTTPLEELLHRRAERADEAPDVTATVAQARTRAADLRRKRRNTAGAVSGVAIVLALVSALVLVTSGPDGDANSRNRPAGGPAPTSAPATPSRSTSPSAAVSSSARPTTSTSSALSTGGRLVKAKIAPKRAPLAVLLAPQGWGYLNSVSDATIYGPPGTNRDASSWAGKLALIVGSANGSAAKYDLTIAGHRALLGRDDVVGWTVTIRYTPSVDISIYVPYKSRLSRDQVIKLANSLQVRRLSSVAHG